MTYPRFCHDGNRDRVHYPLYHLGVGHAGYTSFRSNIGWHTFQSHNCACSCFFCDPCLEPVSVAEQQASLRGCEYLFSIDNIHDDPTLQHLRQTGLDIETRGCRSAILLRSVSQRFDRHIRISVMLDYLRLCRSRTRCDNLEGKGFLCKCLSPSVVLVESQ